MRRRHLGIAVVAVALAAATAPGLISSQVSALAPPVSDELTVSPSCGEPGTTDLVATGEVQPGDREVRITRPVLGAALLLLDDGVVGEGFAGGDGTFEIELDMTLGEAFVELTAEADDDGDWVAFDTFVVGPCPAVTATPSPYDRGSVPSTITFAISGFIPDRDVELSIEGSAFASLTPENPLGTDSVTLPVSIPPRCGSYDVTAATEEPDGQQQEASTVLVVGCPTLSAAPPGVSVRDLPRPVSLSGSGWAPDTEVRLQIGASGPVVTTMRTDTNGVLSGLLPIGIRPCGPVTIRATEVARAFPVGAGAAPMSTISAAAVGSVLHQPESATTSITIFCSDPPTLVVTPAVASTGSVVQAVATNLDPSQDVLLVWVDEDGRTLPGATKVIASATGTFRVPVLVMPRSMTGGRQLQLFDAAAPGSPPQVQAPALIVVGSQEPGRDRLLGRT